MLITHKKTEEQRKKYNTATVVKPLNEGERRRFISSEIKTDFSQIASKLQQRINGRDDDELLHNFLY